MVEQLTRNEQVVGSIPTSGSRWSPGGTALAYVSVRVGVSVTRGSRASWASFRGGFISEDSEGNCHPSDDQDHPNHHLYPRMKSARKGWAERCSGERGVGDRSGSTGSEICYPEAENGDGHTNSNNENYPLGLIEVIHGSVLPKFVWINSIRMILSRTALSPKGQAVSSRTVL